MKLITQMEEEAGRFTGETAHRSKDKVGGNQEIGDVGGVDFASDSGVVAGGAFVFQDGPSIGGDPDQTKDGGVQGWGSGAKVVEKQVVFVESKDFSQVEGGNGGVANGDDGGGVESSGGDHIVMRGGGFSEARNGRMLMIVL
jgi:hypothetical protein